MAEQDGQMDTQKKTVLHNIRRHLAEPGQVDPPGILTRRYSQMYLNRDTDYALRSELWRCLKVESLAMEIERKNRNGTETENSFVNKK